jgi:hypothetical protein
VFVVPSEVFDDHVEIEAFAAPAGADGVGFDVGVADGASDVPTSDSS